MEGELICYTGELYKAGWSAVFDLSLSGSGFEGLLVWNKIGRVETLYQGR